MPTSFPKICWSTASRVCVIDFDDAGFGWHLFELATSLYFITDDEHVSPRRARR